ncbi:MAG: MFS transporter [Alphaproteobacteria bacterium]
MAVKSLKTGFIPVIKTYKGLIAAAFTLMVFSGFCQSVFFGVYLPEIQDRFEIKKTALGSLYAAATVLSALLMAWSGKFLDSMPLTRFISVVLIGLALGCVLMALATHPLMLFLAFLLLRQFGQGLMTLSGTTAINRYIEEGRGRAQSLAQTGLPVHSALFPVAGIFILESLGYTASWIVYAVFIVLVLLPFYWILLRSHEEKTHKVWRDKIDEAERTTPADLLPDQWTRNRVLKDWRFYVIMAVMIIPPCFGTCVFFYQSVLADHHGITAAAFAGGFVFLTLASVTSALVAGVVMDQWGEGPLLLSFPLIYALGLLALAFAPGMVGAYIGLSIIGIGGGMMTITGGPLFAKLYGTKHYGSIKSLSVIAMILASAVSPPLAGYLLDNDIGIASILVYFALYSLLAWGIIVAGIKKITKTETTGEARIL